MKDDNIFKKFHFRLTAEGIIKAAICVLIVAFAASIIPAVIAYLNDRSWVWLSIIIWVIPTAVFTPVVYYLFFRPTAKEIAKRVDRLGMEERLITMIELEKDESYIALKQREDAKENLGKVDRKNLKLSIFLAPIIILSIVAVAAISMTTVAALGVSGPMEYNPKNEWEAPVALKYTYVEAHYIPDYGGYIEGDLEQIIVLGGNASTVVAVPSMGFVFYQWSDGLKAATRTDYGVREELTVYAIFVVEETPEPQPQDREEYVERNHVLDGETYYRDVDYLEDEMKEVVDGDLSAEMKKIIELYFQTID